MHIGVAVSSLSLGALAMTHSGSLGCAYVHDDP